MKIIRVLEGERYTAAAGTGYMSATADEDGFEIDDRGAVFWVTDAELEAAIQERNRTVQLNEASTEVEPATEPKSAGVDSALSRFYDVLIPPPVASSERCHRCDRPGSKGPCPFDCETCHRCGKKLAPGRVRLFTTEKRVYCMDCGTHA